MSGRAREADTTERLGIAMAIAKHLGEERFTIYEDLCNTPIPVLDAFMSDGPGYTGPIYFVVFGGGPEFHMVLIKSEGKFEIVESEFTVFKTDGYDEALDLENPHDPGCTGPPCDCLPEKECVKCEKVILRPELAPNEDELCETCAFLDLHESDDDCQGWIDDESQCCVVCGAGHGDPCPECSGKAYHKDNCSLSDAFFEA